MRMMAVDLGDARTGLAVSDLLGMLWLAELICEEAEKRGVERIVLGLPKNMDGTEGPRAEKSRAFREMLSSRTSLPVILWDERRSSVEAHQILHMNGKREKKHRATVDAVAASLILEGYLASEHE